MFLDRINQDPFFGIVEGLQNGYRLSSTGHLILLQDFVQFKNQDPAFMEMFNVVIQLGAILAVVVIYFDKLYPFKPGKISTRSTSDLAIMGKGCSCNPPSCICFKLDD